MKKLLIHLSILSLLGFITLPMIACAPKEEPAAESEEMGQDMGQATDESMGEEGMTGEEGMGEEGMGEEGMTGDEGMGDEGMTGDEGMGDEGMEEPMPEPPPAQ